MQQASELTLLSPKDVVRRYGGRISYSTFAKWRCNDDDVAGPSFMRIGGRIYYPLEKIIEWEKANTYSKTSEYAAGKSQSATNGTGLKPTQAR